jgi:hypothetical protein
MWCLSKFNGDGFRRLRENKCNNCVFKVAMVLEDFERDRMRGRLPEE